MKTVKLLNQDVIKKTATQIYVAFYFLFECETTRHQAKLKYE